MKDRFTIDCSYCGFLTTEKTLAEALETARRLSLRHNKPNEKITIFDRLAQRGVCNTWDIDGRCIGYKELSQLLGRPTAPRCFVRGSFTIEYPGGKPTG